MTLNSVSSPRGALGYCFVEMTDEATAERCLRKINGKPLPGANPVWRTAAATAALSFVLFFSSFIISEILFICWLIGLYFLIAHKIQVEPSDLWKTGKRVSPGGQAELSTVTGTVLMTEPSRSAALTLSSCCRQMYSLFVGDLTPDVDDGMLYEFFYNRYPSCRGGKVVLDSMGNSK